MMALGGGVTLTDLGSLGNIMALSAPRIYRGLSVLLL